MPLLVNGVQHDPEVGPEWTLLRLLRERLGLTAAKPGCGEGVCGACTVLVGGQPARSCVTTLAEVGARPVVTLEGLAPAGMLHPLQQAFLELSAFQCGYCTPGMIVSAAALLAADPDPDDDAIASALQGNVCRCCAYPRILRAVGRAAELGPQPVTAPAAPQEQAFERPAQPWDLVSSGERDWFAVLPDGLVAVAEAESGRWTTSAGAWVHVGAGGAVTAFTGKVDVGQGNSTALAVLVAAELGVEPDAVRMVMGDTDLCPYDEGTFGSRSMADAGPLLRAAAAAARRSLAERPLGEGERRVEVASRGVTQLPAAPAAAARRQGGLGIVTGSVRFPGDLSRPAMLHGSAAKPPSPDARLQSVDEAAADAVPGAAVVREGSFVGVAAGDRETLDRAVQALSVEWEPPAGPDEGELEAYLRSHPAAAEGWMAALDEEVGDVRSALAEAPVRLEATYRTAYVAHVPLETRAAVAEWDGGRLTVWTGTQRPFGVRAELADELSLAEEQVRVIAPTAGAGFGGKHRGEAALEAARLARATGRPVKVHWTRAEEFAAAYLRPAAVIDVRSGARSDGTLAAWEFVNVGSGAAGIASPYPVPNRRLVFQPAESPLRQGSYRALAATANHFARESHVDELAHEVGADPLELRLRQLEDDRLADVLRAAADRAGWDERGAALGIACGVEKDARVATCAEVRVDGDGAIRATRIVTAFDCGAIVDPDNLVNQIQGATVMGLGGALFERIRFARGRLVTQSLAEYRVPRFGDVPAIEVVLLDRRDVAPAGAGETPIVCVAPAIANALHAATGERRRSLPLLDPARSRSRCRPGNGPGRDRTSDLGIKSPPVSYPIFGLNTGFPALGRSPFSEPISSEMGCLPDRLVAWTGNSGFGPEGRILHMAASPRQRQKAADVLRAGGTQKEAARAAEVKSVTTIKRWLEQPAFRAMISTSPDIRPGAPTRMGDGRDTPESQQDVRPRMWVAGGREGNGDVLGSYLPPSAYEAADAVVHVHVVRPEAVDDVRASIGAGAYPAESPYIPVPVAGLDDLLDNLPLVSRLGSPDQRESLMAWLEVWTFVDEGGRTRTLAQALWDGQRRFLEALLDEGDVLSIKSRKVGLSTLVCAHAAWTVRIRDVNAAAHLLSYRVDAAQELLRSLRQGFEELPAFLRLPLARGTSTVLSFSAGPGDRRSLKAFPATPNAAIESTSSHLVLDEWAHTFDPEAVWAAVEPTLAPRATSALITTARGPGDFVHDYYLRSEAGQTRHTAVFVSALERPDRSSAWLEEKRGQEGKIRSLRNYPLSAAEAFASAGEPYFAPDVLEAAQENALPPSPARRGDRYLKAWDVGRKDASVCVVLRAPARDEEQVYHVVGYRRLIGEDFPSIQREIKKMHAEYPGPTVVEANSIGLPIIQNLRLPAGAVIEHTTTQASKLAMLTQLELLLQERTLKIHSGFRELFAELADYRQPDGSITQDSVMALGFAVANAERASAHGSGARLNRDLFYELNGGGSTPPSWWLDRQKISRDGLAYGLVKLNPPPGVDSPPYRADSLTGELEEMLAQGWTRAAP